MIFQKFDKIFTFQIRDELDKVKETLPKVEIKAEVIDTAAIMNATTSKKEPLQHLCFVLMQFISIVSNYFAKSLLYD